MHRSSPYRRVLLRHVGPVVEAPDDHGLVVLDDGTEEDLLQADAAERVAALLKQEKKR